MLTAAIVMSATLLVAWRTAVLLHPLLPRPAWGQVLIVGERWGWLGLPWDKRVLLYDPASNSSIAPTPWLDRRCSGPAVLLTIGPNAGRVLVAGCSRPRIGVSPFDFGLGSLEESTELYDPAENRFLRGPKTHNWRGIRVSWLNFWDGTATVITSGPNVGQILFVWDAVQSSELYNPIVNRFALGPEIKTGGFGHTATVIRSGPHAGKILFAGGQGGPGPISSTELYDPAGSIVEPGPNMITGRWGHTATVIPSGSNVGKILIAGGSNADSFVQFSSTEIYDPATNTFKPGPEMKESRYWHTATLITSGPNAGKILFAGGWGHWHDSATEFYDPAKNAFERGPNMNVGYGHTSATLIRSGADAGKVFFTEGLGEPFSGQSSSTEVYDPKLNVFLPGPKIDPDWDPADVVIELPSVPSTHRAGASP